MDNPGSWALVMEHANPASAKVFTNHGCEITTRADGNGRVNVWAMYPDDADGDETVTEDEADEADDADEASLDEDDLDVDDEEADDEDADEDADDEDDEDEDDDDEEAQVQTEVTSRRRQRPVKRTPARV